jgi:hypothetical protein
MPTSEIDAELPPLRVAIDLRLENGAASATWETDDGRRGLAAGAPGDVAQALAAVVRRLAGVPVAVQAGGETQRVRVATTDGVPSLA